MKHLLENALYFVLMSAADLQNLLSVSEFRKCLTTLATDLLGYFIGQLIHPYQIFRMQN